MTACCYITLVSTVSFCLRSGSPLSTGIEKLDAIGFGGTGSLSMGRENDALPTATLAGGSAATFD